MWIVPPHGMVPRRLWPLLLFEGVEAFLCASRRLFDDLTGEVGTVSAVGDVFRDAAVPQGALPGPGEDGFRRGGATAAPDVLGREPQRFRGPLRCDAFERVFVVALGGFIRLAFMTLQGAVGGDFARHRFHPSRLYSHHLSDDKKLTKFYYEMQAKTR